MANQVLEKALTLLYPHKCLCCSEVLVGLDCICPVCEKNLPLTGDRLCPVCGKAQGDCICDELGGVYSQATAALFYTPEIAYGIHKYKYDGCQYYTSLFAALLLPKVRQLLQDNPADLVTYVPMHPKKKMRRGFSPAELLAGELGARLQLKTAHTLLRNTGLGKTQMEQRDNTDRKENAKRSFKGNREIQLDGMCVLLLDDVLTSGATMARCADLLRKMGAGKVYAAAVATTISEKTARNLIF